MPAAEILYRDILARNPASFLAHDNLGVLKLDTQPEEALAHLNEAIRLNPDTAEVHDDRGVALQRMGRLDEAVREYREAVRLLPNFPGAHNNLGNALLALGRPEEAAAASREALRLDPGFLDAHYNLGLALIALDRPGASDEFEAAIRLQPDFAEAHYYLGAALRRAGRRDEALVQYADAARLRPGLADAHFSLAGLLQEMGRDKEAVPHYEDALGLAPNSPLAHNDLGVALLNSGRVDEALIHFTEAVRNQAGLPRRPQQPGRGLRGARAPRRCGDPLIWTPLVKWLGGQRRSGSDDFRPSGFDHSRIPRSGSPGHFRRRLIPLICADWLPHDLLTSGSCLALPSGTRPRPIP